MQQQQKIKSNVKLAAPTQTQTLSPLGLEATGLMSVRTRDCGNEGTRSLKLWLAEELASNINKHIEVGQYSQEGSTKPFAAPPQWAWNNTTHTEITLRAQPKPTCWVKLKATAADSEAATMTAMGNNPSSCWHSQVHASYCWVPVRSGQDKPVFVSTDTCCKSVFLY